MTTSKFDPKSVKPPVTVIFDGSNDAAVHETRFLQSKNRDSMLAFVDLAASSASAEDFGADAATAKQKLFVRDADGQIFTGTDALYAAHTAIGLASWFEMCRLPGFLSVGTGIRPKS